MMDEDRIDREKEINILVYDIHNAIQSFYEDKEFDIKTVIPAVFTILIAYTKCNLIEPEKIRENLIELLDKFIDTTI